MLHKPTFLFCWSNSRKLSGRTGNLFVGVAGLEPATTCTPCKHASQLHHTPIMGAQNYINFYLSQLLR